MMNLPFLKKKKTLDFGFNQLAYSRELVYCLKQRILDTEEAKYLLDAFPADIKQKFRECLFEPDNPKIKDILDFLLKNSETAKIIKRFPGSAEAFEYLYLAYDPNKISPVDRYYLKSKAGIQIHRRLTALRDNIPFWLEKIYKGKKLLIDNIASGPGRDMIEVLKKFPGWRKKVQVRNIDIDPAAIDIGKRLVKEYGLEENFSFECKKYSKAELRKADLVILVGVLCPLPMEISIRVMKSMRLFSKPGGLIICSTAQKELIYDDPLTDFLMKITGWYMDYKTDQDVSRILSATGWKPIGEFYDEPLRHHKMTVAQLN
ncbi:MAG: class I SAM-dependent methyltransferase [Patescibacteria group bacterium]